MDFHQKELREFYIRHLKETILSFWTPRCLDREMGGYLNCYDNAGERLLSKNKFIWSQGRFVWAFSKLAGTSADIFTAEERRTFLEYAAHGIDFLRKHAILPDKFACTYLTDQAGNPIYSDGEQIYDASIYVDCFVIIGFAKYALVTGDKSCYDFAERLYRSVAERIEKKDYHVLPYARPEGRKMHGVPMICLNTAAELFQAAKKLGKETEPLKSDIAGYASEILEHFCDSENRIHEIVTEDNRFTDDLLGRHINPGHSIEDLWFLLDAADILGREDWRRKCCAILRRTLQLGWDQEFGGVLLYVDQDGGKPKGSSAGFSESENMVARLKHNWDSKLYWVHSESLYTTLRCFLADRGEDLWRKYVRLHEYVFSVFPNPNRETGEWIQVRKRDGSPDDKLVGLPVKDPFHITRNLILAIELLS